MEKNDLKIAIIGAGPAGLSCAIECERLGVIPDVFERSDTVGWMWPSSMVLINVFETGMGGNIRKYLLDTYNIDIQPSSVCKELVMKSPNEKAVVKGNIGLFYNRGKIRASIENQLSTQLKRTAIHFRRPADYKELAKKYDYVVVATGKDTAARELGVWQDLGQVYIRGGIAYGEFNPSSTTFYWNTEYAGRGYARVTPIDTGTAILGVYNIGGTDLEADRQFVKFLEYEGLEHLEFSLKVSVPIFSLGKVSKFKLGNILLAGRSAGLTERLMGAGCLAAIGSGIYAARAMIKCQDYDTKIKDLQKHIENISSFRKIVDKLDNQGLDKLIATLNTPGIKQIIYNSEINFVDAIGMVLKNFYKNEKVSV